MEIGAELQSTSPAKPTVSPTGRRIRKKQFSLATLLLVVLWVASAINVWMYRQAWVIVDDFKNAEVWYSKDSAKCMLTSSSESRVIDAHTGAFVAQAPFKPGWYASISANWERAARLVYETDKPPRIELYDGRNSTLEQTVDCGAYVYESHFSDDSELFFASERWIRAYRCNQKEREWSIDVLKTSVTTPPAQGSVEADKAFRDLQRAVVEAQNLSDLETNVEKLGKLPHPDLRIDVRLSPYTDVAVTLLVTTGETRAFSWNLDSGRRNAELEHFVACDARKLVFSDDDCLGVLDQTHGKVSVWDLATGRMRASWKVSDGPIAEGNLALCRGGRVAATLTGKGIRPAAIHGDNIRLWECASGRLIKEMTAIQFATFSPDGERMIGVDHSHLVIFDTDTGTRLCSLPVPSGPCSFSLKYAPDGRSMAVIAGNPVGNMVRLYSRRHPESAFGVLALPGSWILLAASVLLIWKLLHRKSVA